MPEAKTAGAAGRESSGHPRTNPFCKVRTSSLPTSGFTPLFSSSRLTQQPPSRCPENPSPPSRRMSLFTLPCNAPGEELLRSRSSLEKYAWKPALVVSVLRGVRNGPSECEAVRGGTFTLGETHQRRRPRQLVVQGKPQCLAENA